MVREISMNHICKIEGHAHLDLKIEGSKVERCELKASEGARFFEALVVGKNVDDVQEIVSRICGICSCSHSVASVQGIEEALGIVPSKGEVFVREMLILGERIRSHATHLYFMSLPDYFGADSVLSLGKEHKDKIDDALKIVSVGNKIIEGFGGRDMHPFLSETEGGRWSVVGDSGELIKEIAGVREVVLRAVDLFCGLKYPEMNRDVDYLCLRDRSGYADISGSVKSESGSFIDDDYKKHLSEDVREYATSKFVLKDGKPYMLGAMARVNNNHDRLGSESKRVFSRLGLKFPLTNPYHNLICQAVELLEAIDKVVRLLGEAELAGSGLLVVGCDKGRNKGRGVSAVEAPRGTLFHEYKVEKGKVVYCNIITPTCQNLNMMERDIVLLVEGLLEKGTSKKDIVGKIEMLIRAYDPCFSCSTHFLKVCWL